LQLFGLRKTPELSLAPSTGSIAFGRNGLSSSNGRFWSSRPFAHPDRFSGHKGAGKAGCQPHPQPRMQRKVRNSIRGFTTGTPKQSGLPCAMV